MLARIKQFFLWNRTHRLSDQAKAHAVLKTLWPWYVPLWILPAFFISDCFLNGMSNQRAAYWLIPFIVCFGILLVRTWKLEMRRPEMILVFKLGPVVVLLISALVWAWIHDNYMR